MTQLFGWPKTVAGWLAGTRTAKPAIHDIPRNLVPGKGTPCRSRRVTQCQRITIAGCRPHSKACCSPHASALSPSPSLHQHRVRCHASVAPPSSPRRVGRLDDDLADHAWCLQHQRQRRRLNARRRTISRSSSNGSSRNSLPLMNVENADAYLFHQSIRGTRRVLLYCAVTITELP